MTFCRKPLSRAAAASQPLSPTRRALWLTPFLLPLQSAWAAESALPPSLRIATVARVGAAGKTYFSGSTLTVIEDKWLETELGKLGVRLEWVPATVNAVAAQVNEAFASKSIDFAAYGDLPSIIANASGLHTQLIVPGGSLNNTYLVVPANSTAQSIKDLKGKRIALHRGRPWEYQFSQLLEANDLSFADVKVLNLNPQAGAAAVATGGADAFFTLSDAFTLEDKKVGRIIWSSKKPPQDWKMRAELWGDAGFIGKYPQLTQLVATAFVRAHHQLAADSGREAFIRNEAEAGQNESVVRRELANDATLWKDRWSPQLSDAVRKHYTDLADYAKRANLINRPVNVDSLFAPQFVKQSLAQLKINAYWTS
jgi:sulfonate transport system substrate-binding protein